MNTNQPSQSTTPYTHTPGALGTVIRSLMDIESLLIGMGQMVKGDIDAPEMELIKAAIERGLHLKHAASAALPDDGDWTEELAAAYAQRLVEEQPASGV